MGKIDLPSPEVEVAVWGQDVGGGSGVQFGMYFEVPVRHSSGVVKQAGGAGGSGVWERDLGWRYGISSHQHTDNFKAMGADESPRQ